MQVTEVIMPQRVTSEIARFCPPRIGTESAGIENFLSRVPDGPRQAAGRGVVMCVADAEQFTPAYVSIRLLRYVNCALPIELWHDGPGAVDETMCDLVKAFDVRCIDIARTMPLSPAARPCAVGLKPYAAIHSRFREALILDPSCLLVADPEPLFGSAEFKASGALLWKSLDVGAGFNRVRQMCGAPEGAVAIDPHLAALDRIRNWRALWFYYFHAVCSDSVPRVQRNADWLLGLALTSAGETHIQATYPPEACDGLTFHYGFDGNLLFQHNVNWSYSGDNRTSTCDEGPIHAAVCQEFLRDLRTKWDGRVFPLGEPTAQRRSRSSVRVLPAAPRILPQDATNREMLSIRFDHGLGDCANFVHVLELYKKRGYEIEVHSAPDKRPLFDACGVKYTELKAGVKNAPYPEPPGPQLDTIERYGLFNKSIYNVGIDPLPYIGNPEELWEELVKTRVDLSGRVPVEARSRVREFLALLPRPIVLLHTMGNSFKDLKNMPPDAALQLYKSLLDRMDGGLVLLDWDSRVPRLASGRVRHLTDDWERIDLPTLLALLFESDLLISVDSGPLHLARLTDIPTIGLLPSVHQHPTRVVIPHDRLICMVPHDATHSLNRQTRTDFHIVEYPGDQMTFDIETIANTSARALSGARYLSGDRLAADIQLQQFVLDWEAGGCTGLSAYVDRRRGFDILFREMTQRFVGPAIVETGCIRSWEDWKGAGYSTYLLGAYASQCGGSVTSVDIDAGNCAFAREATRKLGCVNLIQMDSSEYLSTREEPVDVLLLDSMDTNLPGSAEHCLNEIKAALPLLHVRSIVAIDDTVYSKKAFVGNGSLAIPWLLDRGWKVLHSGYQTICVRAL